MASPNGPSSFPVIVGGFVVMLILCVGAYFVFGPASESKATPGATAVHYPGDPVSGEPVKLPSGLAYYDLKTGTGETAAKPPGQVTVHYTGWLPDGKKFDSSVDRGQPFTTFLKSGPGGVITGWVAGIATMKIGGKRKLIIPSNMGYGPNGSPPSIPPNSTLIFDVELLSNVRR